MKLRSGSRYGTGLVIQITGGDAWRVYNLAGGRRAVVTHGLSNREKKLSLPRCWIMV